MNLPRGPGRLFSALCLCTVLVTTPSPGQETRTPSSSRSLESQRPEGGITLTVTAQPESFLRGDPFQTLVVLENHDREPTILEVDASLSGALFVDGTDGVAPEGEGPSEQTSDLTWPRLRLDPGQTGELRFRAVSRLDVSDEPLTLDVGVLDFGTGEPQRVVLSLEPVWPEGHGRTTWARFLSGFGISLGIGMLTALGWGALGWRRAGGGARGGCLVLGLLAAGFMVGLFLVMSVAEDVHRQTGMRESTCTVTELMLVSAPSTEIGSSTSSRRESEPRFGVMSAVLLETQQGVVPAVSGDGDTGSYEYGVRAWALDQVAPFDRGGTYPCWYDEDDPTSVLLDRSLRPWRYVMVLAVLGLALLPLALLPRLRARAGRNATPPSPPSDSASGATPPSPEPQPAGSGKPEPQAIGSGQDRFAITHPLVRSAAERALRERGQSEGILARQGQHLYFDVSRIPHEGERERARELLGRLLSDQADMEDPGDLLEVTRLIQRWM